MGILNKMFFGKWEKKAPVFLHKKQEMPTIETFPKLKPIERIATIMTMGDTGKAEFFPFLKYAILNDTDKDVKFAALKRVHLFYSNSEEVVSILTEMKNNADQKESEPYFSMALTRLGIITLKEFDDTINEAK